MGIPNVHFMNVTLFKQIVMMQGTALLRMPAFGERFKITDHLVTLLKPHLVSLGLLIILKAIIILISRRALKLAKYIVAIRLH